MSITIGAIVIILIIGLFLSLQNTGDKATTSDDKTHVYSLDELKRIGTDRTQILNGIAGNTNDPFGKLSRTLLVRVQNTTTPLPIYITNAPLWMDSELGKNVTVTGSALSKIIERDSETGSEDFAYYTILDIQFDESHKTKKPPLENVGTNFDTFPCRELGFVFSFPHMEGYVSGDVFKGENICKVRYKWTGALDKISNEYLIATIITDKVVKPAPPINRNEHGIFYRRSTSGVDFHLPNKTVSVTIHTPPEGASSSFTDTISKTFRIWTEADERIQQNQKIKK